MYIIHKLFTVAVQQQNGREKKDKQQIIKYHSNTSQCILEDRKKKTSLTSYLSRSDQTKKKKIN